MRLSVELEPWRMRDGSIQIKYTVRANQDHTWTHVFTDFDELESVWDIIWKQAEQLLKRAVVEAREKAMGEKP